LTPEVRNILEYAIREFAEPDAEKTSRMLLSAFEWFHKGDKNSWLYRSFAPDNIVRNSNTLDILVADMNSEIIGFISSSNTLFGAAYIPTVAVDRAQQRSGIGKRLLDYKLAILKKQGMRKAWLLVTSINLPAITFYLKEGFVIEGYLRNHTGPGLDEVLFSKFLV
jgi:ribosomal protein S18 acetylase RimI-like enzyme